MSDFAAQLVDRVIPRVPVRQWVLTVPHGLRAKMMFDPALTSAVLRELIREVSSWLRQRARRQAVVGAVRTGAVTVIQRFNSALGANPHFHTLFLDGVYTFPVGRAPVFHPTPVPTDEDVARVAGAVFRRVERRLAEREPGAVQRRFVEGAPVLVAMAEASVGGVVASGPRRGRRIVRVCGVAADLDAFVMGRLCADVEGFNLQAATRIAARDREGLERMARYLARPPIATDRLSRLDDGRLELRLKRPWRNGTTAFVYTPHELLERLVAIVPRPAGSPHALLRCLRARVRSQSADRSPDGAGRAKAECWSRRGGTAEGTEDAESVAAGIPDLAGVSVRRPRMRGLQGRMEIVAALTWKPAITRVLGHLGLSADAPGFHPARPPPQVDLPSPTKPRSSSLTRPPPKTSGRD